MVFWTISLKFCIKYFWENTDNLVSHNDSSMIFKVEMKQSMLFYCNKISINILKVEIFY